MTDPFQISAHERGTVRVFTTDLDTEGNATITPENVARLLGDHLDLDPSRIEVFPSNKLDPMRLSEYLREGYGIPPEQLDGKSSALDSLKGVVILVASSAFNGKAVTLDPKESVRFIGAFSENEPEPPRQMAAADDPQETLQPRGAVVPPSRGKGPGGMVIIAALLLAVAILLVLVL